MSGAGRTVWFEVSVMALLSVISPNRLYGHKRGCNCLCVLAEDKFNRSVNELAVRPVRTGAKLVTFG